MIWTLISSNLTCALSLKPSAANVPVEGTGRVLPTCRPVPLVPLGAVYRDKLKFQSLSLVEPVRIFSAVMAKLPSGAFTLVTVPPFSALPSSEY